MLKSEGVKTIVGVIIIIIVFAILYHIFVRDRNDTELFLWPEHVSYFEGFPYYLPFLDIPIREGFNPWGRRTGLQRPPEFFAHQIEFRIDKETNMVHTKFGVTSPRYTPLSTVDFVVIGVAGSFIPINDNPYSFQEGRTYFHFLTPISIFRHEERNSLFWYFQEAGDEGELIIFEARITR